MFDDISLNTYIGYLDAEEEGGAGQPSRVLAPREPEARGPVGERAEAHVQPVLDQDVHRVLGPGRKRKMWNYLQILFRSLDR